MITVEMTEHESLPIDISMPGTESLRQIVKGNIAECLTGLASMHRTGAYPENKNELHLLKLTLAPNPLQIKIPHQTLQK